MSGTEEKKEPMEPTGSVNVPVAPKNRLMEQVLGEVQSSVVDVSSVGELDLVLGRLTITRGVEAGT